MGNKKKIYDAAFAELSKLGIRTYDTQYLANMVLRKIRHPEEKMDEISKHVERKMAKIYRHTELRSEMRLNLLQEALDASETISEDWLRDLTVSRTVKEIAAKVIKTLDQEEFDKEKKEA